MSPDDLEATFFPEQLFSPHRHAHGSPLTRRRFLGGAAGAIGAAAGATLLGPSRALASDLTPRPIPGGIVVGGQQFHVFFFGPGLENSTITDFNGFVGVSDVRGTGTATHPDGSHETLLYDTDMRFMKGVYRSVDGTIGQGTFGFV